MTQGPRGVTFGGSWPARTTGTSFQNSDVVKMLLKYDRNKKMIHIWKIKGRKYILAKKSLSFSLVFLDGTLDQESFLFSPCSLDQGPPNTRTTQLYGGVPPPSALEREDKVTW